MLERWTRAVLRFRTAVLVSWLVVVAVGAVAVARLPAQLSTSFAVPGTESERARVLLERHFGERPDGTFVVVVRHVSAAQLERRLRGAAVRAVPGGRVAQVDAAGGVAFGEIATSLDLTHAKRWTEPLRAALAADGGPRAYVTGQPAVQHDLDPVLRNDLWRGEAVAVPIALLVLVVLFGWSLAVLVPFAFALCTITATLAAVYAIAHGLTMVTYVTNLVELIGLGLAIDYSLLVVHRFREELQAPGSVDDAVVRTLDTAGRAVVFSGAAVAIGLASLLVVPVPLIRSLGVGGVLVPLASIAASLTLQPAVLSLLGRRAGTPRVEDERHFWPRLAAAMMRRPVPVLVGATAALLLAAVPALHLHVTPGSFTSLPASLESARGLRLLREHVGTGVGTPTQVVVDTGAAGRARSGPGRAGVARLADELFHDSEVLIVANGRRPPYVDATGRYARIFVAARHDYGTTQAQRLVHRLRGELVPRARFPAGTTVAAGGPAPQGRDFLDRSYDAFPWLVAAVLAVTFLVLLRAFRSLLLPLKAVLLNLLSVAATYGLLHAIFRHPVDGWIPIVLFATLFGLSMDYEVFMVTRMRETWDATRDNMLAVATGLEKTGRIVTAAAAIMVAAFGGFVVGRVPALQQFGVGLCLAVAIDATVIRAVLVPSLMAILGRWNWWLPGARAGEPPAVGPPPT